MASTPSGLPQAPPGYVQFQRVSLLEQMLAPYPEVTIVLSTSWVGSQLPEDLMLHAGLWIHGHTHSSATYRIGDAKRYVRVVCNPRSISHR